MADSKDKPQNLTAANVLNGQLEKMVSRKTAKAFLLDRGIEPMQCIVDCYTKAMTAFDTTRGDNDFAHYGPQYLAIAAKMAETMAKYSYPSFKAVEHRVHDEQMSKDVSSDKLKINPGHIRQIILEDPMSKNAAKLNETSAERMDKAISTYAASLAKGEKEVLGNPILPGGNDGLPD